MFPFPSVSVGKERASEREVQVQIGKPRKRYLVEPVVSPVPQRDPVILPPEPRVPEKVPTKQ